MKRLIAVIGLTYLIVLSIVFYLSNTLTFVIGCIAFLIFILSVLIRRFRAKLYLPVASCVALLACCVNLFYTATVYTPVVDNISGKTTTVTATLTDEPVRYYDSYLHKFEAHDNILNKNYKFLLYYEEPLKAETFDTVQMDVEFYAEDNNNNIAKGYFICASLGYDKVSYTVNAPSHKPIRYYAIKLRQYMRNALSSTLSQDASALCQALLIGDKYAIDNDTRHNFMRAGASHLIVVSGMHFSIIIGFFLFFAKKFKQVKVPVLISGAVVAVVYMFVTGFSASVVRSAVMLLICILSKLVRYDVYTPNSMAIAALVLTLTNPYIAGEIGLILSFSSTYAIVKFTPHISRRLISLFRLDLYSDDMLKHKKFALKLITFLHTGVEMLSVCISAYIASFFLSIFMFDSLSTVAIISSFILYLPIMLLLILSMLICILFYIPVVTLLTIPIAHVTELLATFVYFFIDTLSSVKFSYINITSQYVYLWVVLTLVLLSIIFMSKDKAALTLSSLLSVLIFIVGFVANSYFVNNSRYLYVYDPDNCMAIAYKSVEVDAVLSFDVNSFNRSTVISKLEKDFSDIEFCSSVTNSKSAANSLVSLTNTFAIDSVLLYDTKRTVTVGDTITPTEDFTVKFSDDVYARYYMVNDSYITYFYSKGTTALLVNDYIDASYILQSMRDVDILITSKCIGNIELLSCDTLIVCADNNASQYISKQCCTIADNVIMSCDGDIRLKLEV